MSGLLKDIQFQPITSTNSRESPAAGEKITFHEIVIDCRQKNITWDSSSEFVLKL